jgi:ketosteroid isomerase-like protein
MGDPVDVDAVERYLDAWGRGDLAAILGCYDAGLTLVWPGTHPLAGIHVGLDAALTALAALQERTGRALDRVAAVTPTASTVDVEVAERWSIGVVRRTLRFTTREGRIASCEVVEHDDAVVHALLSRG